MERKPISLLACVLMAGCVSSSATTTTTTGTQAPAQTWPVLTRRHVDLWLHGYAMLLRDTTTITIFRPGYRAQIQAVKSQQGVSTELDANRERLQAGCSSTHRSPTASSRRCISRRGIKCGR